MPAMTIVEHSKGSDPLTQAYVEIFASKSDVLAAFPFKNISGGAYPYIVEDEGGGIAFRGINESYTASIGVENPQVESLKISGGDMDVDIALLKMQGEARRAREETKKIKALARGFTDALLSGDSSTDPREFDGLQKRLTGAQVISNSGASGGAALSLAKLDEMIAQVNNPTHLIMNKKFRDVHFKALMRNQTLMGNVEMRKNDVGKLLPYYNDLPMLIGYETGPETGILPFSEAYTGGGTANGSSIYCVSFMDGHACGIQDSPIDVRDLGELDTAPKKRTRVEWLAAMVVENPYSGARLRDIKDAAIVA